MSAPFSLDHCARDARVKWKQHYFQIHFQQQQPNEKETIELPQVIKSRENGLNFKEQNTFSNGYKNI